MTTATVVGSGPNGLAAAIRLAQEGVDVTVVEAASVAGGGLRTSELTLPGVLHDDCATALPGAAGSPFFRSLALEKHGLRWLHHEVVVAHPLGSKSAAIYRDLDRTASAMGRDGTLWRRLFEPLAAHPEALFATAFAPMISFPRHPIMLAKLGLRSLAPAAVVARMFHEPENAAAFMGIAAHIIGDLRAPVSSAVAMMLTTSLHTHGWPIPAGGASSLSAALQDELRALGGRVETGRSVTDVRELGTDLTILTVPPRIAADLVEVPHAVQRAWTRFEPGPAAYKLDIALEGDVPWRSETARRAGVVHLGDSAQHIAQSEALVTQGRMPRHPFVLVAQPWLADASRSHNGVNPLWLYAHVPNAWRGNETERILGELERAAPGVRAQIRAVHVRTPADLEHHNAAYLGGDIAGGASTFRQLVARPRMGTNGYRTGVRGVYLGGASTSPAAGVHGMCGFNAAETALNDLRRS